ncbi:MAG: hypothetical protein ONB05_00615 [candidate division KSB1 bacterium]|nr:hypothetical protein [candidate division KSB1 bacterium]
MSTKQNPFLSIILVLSLVAGMVSVTQVWAQAVGPIKISQYRIDDDEDDWADDDSKGDGDGVAEQGEAIRLPVTLKNLGTETALNVTATLSTQSSLVTLLEATKSFGNIGGGQEKSVEGTWRDGFHFQVSNTATTG